MKLERNHPISYQLQKNADTNKMTTHLLLVLYTRHKDSALIKSIQNNLKGALPQYVTTRSVCICTKICSKFIRAIDQTLKEH